MKRKTTSATEFLVKDNKELRQRIEMQSRVIQVSAKDATRGHAFGMAVVGVAAAVEHLMRAGLSRSAGHLLSALQMVEGEYLEQFSTTKPAPLHKSEGVKESNT